MKSSAVEDIFGRVAEQNLALLADPLSPIEAGILKALVYADVFDYALTLPEIQRYMPVCSASQDEIRTVIASSKILVPKYIEQHGKFYTLAGRRKTVSIRQQRADFATKLWPIALHYARIIARLPFIRMIAVTGALAVDNVDSEADIDFLIITQSGHVWLCRALVIAIVKLAKWQGHKICPNYFLSERALILEDRNLFSAHELAQMVPLADHNIYQQMNTVNTWVRSYLPNAEIASPHYEIEPTSGYWLKSLFEAVFNTPFGTMLENWEMHRKLRRFRAIGGTETLFNADCCKGHFEHHGQRILNAYNARLRIHS